MRRRQSRRRRPKAATTRARGPTPTPAAPPEPPPVEPEVPVEPEPVVEPEAVPVEPAPSATVPDGECANADYEGLDVTGSDVGFDGVNDLAFYGDGQTTVCAEPSTGKLCVSGFAGSSGDSYQYWGSGVALLLQPEPGTFVDLASMGVTAVSFELTELEGRRVRVAISQADDPAIADASQNFEQNAFYFGGSTPMDTATDSELLFGLDGFTQPAWTRLVDPTTGEAAAGLALDVSRVKGLSLQIANNPADVGTPYRFCVSDLVWLSANGEAVDVPEVSDEVDAGTPLTR